MSATMMVVDEKRLADACAGGDDAAWKAMVAAHERGLRRAIQRRLGRMGKDESLVEDLLQDVWLVFLEHPWFFSAYDSDTGSLAAYLAAFGRRRVEWYFKSLTMRKQRHVPLSAAGEKLGTIFELLSEGRLTHLIDKFKLTLSPCLLSHLNHILANPAHEEPEDVTPEYARKLQQRLLARWTKFRSDF